MKFIRKHGRVIPIKEKSEKVNLAIDVGTDFAGGVLAGGFFKRKKAIAAMAVADLGAGLYTLGKRAKDARSFGEFAKKELTGKVLGYGAAIGGFYASRKLLIGLQKIQKAKNAWTFSTKLIP